MAVPRLRVGLKLEVWREDSTVTWITRIEEVHAESFAVSSFFAGAEVHVLRPDDEVKCLLTDKETQAQYGFTAQVIRREVKGVPLYYLSRPKSFVRIQRRAFVRLPVLVPQLFRASEESAWHKGYLLDLSGGGARISHKSPLSMGEQIHLQFTLRKEDGVLLVPGKVVRVERTSEAGPTTFHSGIRFGALPETTQDLIVGYVFERMLAGRRKLEV
ncbi:MAG: Flagellar brake protein YcgR [Firmicutes bacterium]|nr:Flagellar brake protein YcgR [candidate division NPL-UPA2 bacterium]